MFNRSLLVLFTLLAIASPARANGRFPAAQHLVVGPAPSNRTIALRATFGFMVSDDAGASFHYVCEDALGYADLGFLDPPFVLDAQSRLHVGLMSALERLSTDRCTTDVLAAFSGLSVSDLDATPDGRSIVAAVTRTDGSSIVLRSDDAGETFAPLGNGLSNVTLTTLEMARSDPHTLYFSGYGSDRTVRVFVSTDGGATITPLPFTTTGVDDVWVAAIDPLHAGTVYLRVRLFPVSMPDAGPMRPTALMRSTDGGQNWTEIARTRGAMLGFAIDDQGATLWMGGPSDGLLRSQDGGATWVTLQHTHVQCLRAAAGQLYVCADWIADGYAALRSSDGGETLTPMLRFIDVQGAFTCNASSIESTVCASRWHDFDRQFFSFDGGTTPIDASATDAATPALDARGAEPVVPHTGCACTAMPRSRSALWIFALAGLLARRRRRA